MPNKKPHNKVGHFLEVGLFASRWILAPLYVGLALALFLVLGRFCLEFWNLIQTAQIPEAKDNFILGLLGLLDLVLTANLILIVIFAGYENFVSKIEAAKENVDRPHWMGTIDFSGLKLKLIGSLVAISVIELLKDFIDLGQREDHTVGQGLMWRVGIHMVFVLSGVLFALMDFIAEKIKPGAGVDEFGG